MDKQRQNKTFEIVETEEKLPVFIRIHRISDFKMDTFIETEEKGIVRLEQPRLMEHWHKDLEINYIYAGTCDYYVDGVLHLLNSDDLIIINCESIHRVVPKALVDAQDKIAFTLIVEYEFLKHIIPDIDYSIFLVKDAKDLQPMKQKIHQIVSCYETDHTPYRRLAVMGLVYEFLYELCISGAKQDKSIIPINNQKNIERLRGIMQYVENHYKEPMQQTEIANRFYFSREYFCRFFKYYTGITFKEYLTRYRLKKAEELLLESSYSVTDIAMNTGFSDVRRFIQAFKKYYGMTPYQYKLNRVTKR
ncbi:AraC family transcriptional regulator [Anaerosporobacter sp.]|uniref:AraC family transcriptional regulator n=1 Tax=Anaerosporobacter sp. TaxID=1872529 RepID=UPI00286F0B06|nr:AraC family transcriptional regulator [Anaerosporobacter sp.]